MLPDEALLRRIQRLCVAPSTGNLRRSKGRPGYFVAEVLQNLEEPARARLLALIDQWRGEGLAHAGETVVLTLLDGLLKQLPKEDQAGLDELRQAVQRARQRYTIPARLRAQVARGCESGAWLPSPMARGRQAETA